MKSSRGKMGGCTSKDKTVAENEGCVIFFLSLSLSLDVSPPSEPDDHWWWRSPFEKRTRMFCFCSGRNCWICLCMSELSEWNLIENSQHFYFWWQIRYKVVISCLSISEMSRKHWHKCTWLIRNFKLRQKTQNSFQCHERTFTSRRDSRDWRMRVSDKNSFTSFNSLDSKSWLALNPFSFLGVVVLAFVHRLPCEGG